MTRGGTQKRHCRLQAVIVAHCSDFVFIDTYAKYNSNNLNRNVGSLCRPGKVQDSARRFSPSPSHTYRNSALGFVEPTKNSLYHWSPWFTLPCDQLSYSSFFFMTLYWSKWPVYLLSYSSAELNNPVAEAIGEVGNEWLKIIEWIISMHCPKLFQPNLPLLHESHVNR